MKNIFVLLVLSTLVLISCSTKDYKSSNLTTDSTLFSLLIDEDLDKEDLGKDKVEMKSCFELVYPIGIKMPDGNVLKGDKETLWKKVKAWYEMNPEEKEKPSLIFPIDILWKDEVVKTMKNKDDLFGAKKYCKKIIGDDKFDCFKLVYPVQWVMPDGEIISMADEKDWDAIKDWYANHPDNDEKPQLEYPVTIVDKEGSSQEVADESAMIALKKECE